MEVIWLILAILLFLGLSIAYWQKLKKEYIEYHSADSQNSQPRVEALTSKLQEQEIVLQSLPDLTQISLSSTTENQDFSDLELQLEELAKIGWAKDETCWISKPTLSCNDLSNKISPAQVIEILLAHARQFSPEFNVPYLIPRTIVEAMPSAAGQFEVDEEGWVTIKISPNFFDDRLAANAILAHEACHYILENSGIRYSDFYLNERYTDLCMFICGFGQIFLTGYRREPAQNQYRPGHRLGYLTDAEYQFANQYVIKLRELYKQKLQSKLNVKRKRLLQLVHGDESTLKRLVEYERLRSPDKLEELLYESAIDRLERGR
ncbi:MAG: hypothetical protein DCF19_09550 [Pseudanabaena frigida]|uniref:Uncharacterized protein n=1 Tax=Pseudanabaena frigida TaxID=945775 RepID=A0A2W4WAH8_9CYAN|nr:MAG: hypothetical protein DCF19_09550 [Pseudanabaena frigida]